LPDRHASIVDAHVVLRRDGKILLLRRAPGLYAGGQLCLPSGHHENGENITETAARELAEETGIIVKPASLRMVLAMHQRNPEGSARFGFFFEPGIWHGAPVNREPHKHTEMLWADPGDLPADTVGYTAVAVAAIEQGATFTINGWDHPDDAARTMPKDLSCR
jgi:8-oxo-dGTP pyrophosphatase MutT (NUDIX family)